MFNLAKTFCGSHNGRDYSISVFPVKLRLVNAMKNRKKRLHKRFQYPKNPQRILKTRPFLLFLTLRKGVTIPAGGSLLLQSQS